MIYAKFFALAPEGQTLGVTLPVETIRKGLKGCEILQDGNHYEANMLPR
jgi:hypothetical protein